MFYKGTIEFRLFNSTLHAGEVKSAIQLCLAISHQALIQKSARHAKTVSDNEKYTFRTWLLRLGLIGDCEKIKKQFSDFISRKLKMELSEEKTLITHSSQFARFLGYDVRVRRDNSAKPHGNHLQTLWPVSPLSGA